MDGAFDEKNELYLEMMVIQENNGLTSNVAEPYNERFLESLAYHNPEDYERFLALRKEWEDA